MSFIDIHLVTSWSSWVFVLRPVSIPYFPWTRNLCFLEVCICSFFNDDDFLYCLIRISEHSGGSGASGQLGQRGIRRMSVKVLLEWQFRILTQNYEMYFMNLTLLSIFKWCIRGICGSTCILMGLLEDVGMGRGLERAATELDLQVK